MARWQAAWQHARRSARSVRLIVDAECGGAREEALGIAIEWHLDQAVAEARAILAAGARGLEGGDHGARLADLVTARRHYLVDDRDLARVDGALRGIAPAPGGARLGFASGKIGEGIGAVDRENPGRHAFDMETLADIGELDRVLAAYRSQVGGHVLRRAEHARHARACRRNRIGLDDAARRFDIGCELGGAGRNAEGTLQPLHLLGESDDLPGSCDFRQEHDIWP